MFNFSPIKLSADFIAVMTGIFSAMIIAVFKTYILEDMMIIHSAPDTSVFPLYLFFFRGVPFYLLSILIRRRSYAFLKYVFLFYTGFCYSLYTLTATIQYGTYGILLTISNFLPQGLFYIAALYMLCKNSSGNQWIRTSKENLISILAILIWTIGILSEWYVNPSFSQLIK